MSGNDERFVKDIGRIVPRRIGMRYLDPAIYPLPIDGATGTGTDPLPGATNGIASPLTETKYTDREFYTAVTTTSSDGLFVFSVSRLKTLKMLDAKGNPVVFKFANKP